MLRGELVVGLVADELLEPGGDARDPQRAELLVIDAGEHLTVPAGSTPRHGPARPQPRRPLVVLFRFEAAACTGACLSWSESIAAINRLIIEYVG